MSQNEVLTGPFHMFFSYYKYGHSKYRCCATEPDLKKYITKVMTKSPSENTNIKVPSDSDPIFKWIEKFIEYGTDRTNDDAGYGCRYVIANNKLVKCKGIYDIKEIKN